MKTMKHILLIICIACATTTMAIDYTLHSTASGSFSSTHTYQQTTFYGESHKMHATSPQAVQIATLPEIIFRSTSSMPSMGSTILTAEILSEVGDENPAPSGPRRVGPGKPPGDPMDDEDPVNGPLGDAVLPLLLLAVGYSIYLRRKNSVRTPDAGHNQ